jgi:hypothetical protein
VAFRPFRGVATDHDADRNVHDARSCIGLTGYLVEWLRLQLCALVGLTTDRLCPAVSCLNAATRMTSDQLGRIIDAIPWEGEAYDAARTANTNIRRNLIKASSTALVDAEEKHSTALRNVVSELPNSAT